MVSAAFSKSLSGISRLFSTRRRPVKDITHDISRLIIDQVINKKLNAAEFEQIKSLVKELPARTRYEMPKNMFADLDGPGEKEMATRIIAVINHHIPKHGGRSKKKGCKSRRSRHRQTRRH